MRPPADLPKFLQDDSIDGSTLLDVTIDDGSHFTGTIGGLSDDWQRMEWYIVADEVERRRPKRKIVVPIRSVVSATPTSMPLATPTLPQSFDLPDDKPQQLNPSTFTVQSGVLFALLFALLFASWNLHDWFWGSHWQVGAAVAYTVVILVGTFASVNFAGVLPEIPLAQPPVRNLLPRIGVIHVAFLAGILALVTAVLAVQPSLPGWMNAETLPRHSSVFSLALSIAALCIVIKQVNLNRSLLEKALGT